MVKLFYYNQNIVTCIGIKRVNASTPIKAVQPMNQHVNTVTRMSINGAQTNIPPYMIISANRCPSLASRLTS